MDDGIPVGRWVHWRFIIYHGQWYTSRQVDTMVNHYISWMMVYQKAGGYNGESLYIIDDGIPVGRWIQWRIIIYHG